MRVFKGVWGQLCLCDKPLYFHRCTVRVARFFDRLEQLGARRSYHVLKIEARLYQLFDCRLLCVQAILVLASLVDVEVENLLLDDLGILALKGVTLVENVVNAATEGPDVDFLAETALF